MFQPIGMRLHQESLIARCGGPDAKVIFAEQDDGAGAPGVAQALAVRVSIHGVVLRTLLGGIVGLPEGAAA